VLAMQSETNHWAKPTPAEYAMGYAEGFNDACKPKQGEPVALVDAEIRKAVEAEREACAKVCEETDDGTPYNLAEECARNIRARGQA
jgi:hypothetical protein